MEIKLDNKNYLMSEFKKLGCSFINPRHSLCNTIMLILPLLIICNRQFCEIISKVYNVCIVYIVYIRYMFRACLMLV